MANQITRTIGKNTLGSGKKMKVDMKTYSRSTHDIGYVWRNTQAPGTLVPFMVEPMLPGDTFDINLNADVLTHPTIGPLFGTFKLQMDVFQAPIRLYQAALHNNALNIGLDMSKVKLPMCEIEVPKPSIQKKLEYPVNPSSLVAYLGMMDLPSNKSENDEILLTRKSALPLLAYWDIFKNYYANTQETYAYVLHNNKTSPVHSSNQARLWAGSGTPEQMVNLDTPLNDGMGIPIFSDAKVEIEMENADLWDYKWKTNGVTKESNQVWGDWRTEKRGRERDYIIFYNPKISPTNNNLMEIEFIPLNKESKEEVTLQPFLLTNIDVIREDILKQNKLATFIVDKHTEAPYGLSFRAMDLTVSDGDQVPCFMQIQEGLAVKTYQSDLFNNWMRSEWIDGDNGISAITAIDTSDGSFTIDQLNIAKKVYDMLNRIAISGGTYKDWLDTVYTHDGNFMAETPIYEGGASKEIVFQEVVSNAETTNPDGEVNPLGTLAGKGRATGGEGGNLHIRCNEPSLAMGIVSITPRVDYSQGNRWFTRIETMNDWHKPALDEIGFQDLVTDQMMARSTELVADNEEEMRAIGKQPAWINYMTNFNRAYGNFAIRRNQMFMTLNRKYEAYEDGTGIRDVTTYIDPSKFNDIFAQTNTQAMNFWVQIAVNIKARRKMSAKMMPNL